MMNRTMQAICVALGLLSIAPMTAADAMVLSPVQASQDGSEKKEKKKDKQKDPSKAKEPKAPRTPADDSARIAKRGESARNLALFRSPELLPFTLIADFGRIGKDRDSLSQKRYPGTLVVNDDKGAERRIPVQLRTRGHYRLLRRTCSFVNTLVIFPDSGLKGTPFAGQKSLKLGSHCQGSDRYEEILRREYLAYRVYNEISPDRSFRVRLSNATYVDSASGKEVDQRLALWIENEDDVAARSGGAIKEVRGALFDDVDRQTLDDVLLFEYLIGNTDFSMYSLHNMRLSQTPQGILHVLAYDFDFSGLVSAPYASPDPKLPIRNVQQRLYRGPCRTAEEYAPVVERFLSRKSSIMAIPSTIPGLQGGALKDVQEYLKEFFDTLEKPGMVKREILGSCTKQPGI